VLRNLENVGEDVDESVVKHDAGKHLDLLWIFPLQGEERHLYRGSDGRTLVWSAQEMPED